MGTIRVENALTVALHYWGGLSRPLIPMEVTLRIAAAIPRICPIRSWPVKPK